MWLPKWLCVSSVGVGGMVYKTLCEGGVLECMLEVNGCRC